MLITRRRFLTASLGAAVGTVGLGGYAFAYEPSIRLAVTDYAPVLPRWPAGFKLNVAVIADIHAINPWMSLSRIDEIVETTNRLKPDLILLAGDYLPSLMTFGLGSKVPITECARALAGLHAPLGTFTVLGNHDVVHDGGARVRTAFEAAGIPVLVNDAMRLNWNGRPFWLLGLGDQWGYYDDRRWVKLEDLPGTLARITDDAPALLLAHEPDIFVKVPDRVALTVCGHTHGGQIRVPGYGALHVPSHYGTRFAYGHIIENNRHLIVSAGLGTTGLPVRFWCAPEIVMIRLGSDIV